jgi:PelA/Pel-15E family pectate lyase
MRSALPLTIALALAPLLTSAADAPKPWPPDAFLPVTEQRVAALPAAAQPAWRDYLAKSNALLQRTGERNLVDGSSNQPLAGPPIPSTYSKGVKLGAPAAYYATEEARVVADHVVNWQTPVGGWVKTGDYSRDRRPEDDHHDAWSGGTFDNDSTLYELRYLALVQAGAAADASQSARVSAWRACFLRGLDYLFAAQYPNGGFPQVYPLVGWYHDAITFNDDAFVHILQLFEDIADHDAEFAFVSSDRVERAAQGLLRGIQCTLLTQLKDAHGQLTIWAQQLDPLTLQPCAARNFEPIAQCSLESVGLVQFLMTIPQPSPQVVAAIEGAMRWYPAHALHGVVWNRDVATGNALEPKENAPDLWARFYEIGTDRPIFGERDRTIHYNVTELVVERRKGYGWYNSRATVLPAAYAAWQKRLAAKK